jgi:hypothetical protein
MDAQGFLAALTPAVTDADARERFLTDPKAVLAAAGLDLPEWFPVSACEGDAAELTITLPGLLDTDTDLSDAQLDAVSGGSCYAWACLTNPPALVVWSVGVSWAGVH